MLKRMLKVLGFKVNGVYVVSKNNIRILGFQIGFCDYINLKIFPGFSKNAAEALTSIKYFYMPENATFVDNPFYNKSLEEIQILLDLSGT